ncbi:hypothetical protein ACWGJ9_07400 [Curtobacterium citreum]
MSLADDAALVELLRTDAELAKPDRLFDSVAERGDGKPISATWYVVMQPGADVDTIERLAGPQVHRQPSTTFQCVGSTPEQARRAAERVDRTLRPHGFGVVLTVPDRVTTPLMRDYVSPVQRDPDGSTPMWFQTLEYSFHSDPA